MKKIERIMQDALIRCAQGVEMREEKEVIEETLPEGGKRKVERIVRNGPMIEAIKVYYGMREKAGAKDGAMKLVHLVPRPEARDDE